MGVQSVPLGDVFQLEPPQFTQPPVLCRRFQLLPYLSPELSQRPPRALPLLRRSCMFPEKDTSLHIGYIAVYEERKLRGACIRIILVLVSVK